MLLLAATLTGLVVMARTQCLTSGDDAAASADPNSIGTETQLYEGQLPFALNMLETLSTQSPQSNLFFSPLSVYSTLLLAYFISANDTEKILHDALHLPASMSKVKAVEAYKMVRFLDKTHQNHSEGVQLINAYRMFVSEKLAVRECMQTLFQEELEKVDFTKDVKTTVHINQWVSNETRGQITDLIPEGHLSPRSKLVLANSAYFKGFWKSQFQAAKSKKETFHISSTERTLVTMMRQKGTFNHGVSETLGAHILQLPYKGDAISMFVFLPPYAAPKGVNTIIKRMTPANLQEILNEEQMITREVEVGLPKFTVEHSLELVPVLASMGVGNLFNGTADLSALTGEPEVQLNAAVHKAKVQVDEEGTTAAAATAFFTFRSSRPLHPAMFICNHPFVFLLYDSTSHTILFAGVYSRPPTE